MNIYFAFFFFYMNTLLGSSIAALHLALKYWHVELFFYGGQTTTVKIYHSVSIAQGKYWESAGPILILI